MGKRKSPEKASDRERNWVRVFGALVQLSQNLKEDSLILEGRIKHLHEFIHKMKMEHKVDSLKADFFLGSKEREAFVCKHRYENADDEVADFVELFDFLSKKCEETKTSGDASNDKGEGISRNKALRNEVWKLKGEIEKCKTDKNTEISALLSEKDFVWNQFKIMEADMNKKIKKKDEEVKLANDEVRLALNRAEELQAANEKLRSDLARMKSESTQKSEEIEILKSNLGSQLRPCIQRGGKSSISDGGGLIKVKKETGSSSQTSEKVPRTKQTAHNSTGGKVPMKQLGTKHGSNSSSKGKGKAVDLDIFLDTPRLFNQSFQVPKLKSWASPNIV